MPLNMCVVPTNDISPGLDRVERLIADSLVYDWVLRVEHAEIHGNTGNGWLQWGEAEYAVTNAESVMQMVNACHEMYPDHCIRLQADKMHPQTRLLYCIYRPAETSVTERQREQVSENVVTGDIRWLVARLYDGVYAARQKVWRAVAITGMLLASLLMLEELLA